MKPDSWERVAEIFEAARGLAPKERAAFLEKACLGQDTLRERVEELLANNKEAEANGFLERAPEVNSMELAPGTELGHYKLVRLIGAGGMGQVYEATDTRLDRTVAIKVLPPHVAGQPDVRARFEREARTISQLNHPHICTLYDVGRENGVDFLVMEHIEGETLAERLEKRALPLDQALQRGIEIADALDKAHRHGVVHRDLKPGNVMLTKSGAKLLDFGLAKPMAMPSQVGSEKATATKMTQEGTIIGTFQYMAPEQLEGKEADARTDIFTLGSVLYEMVTGRTAFEGNSKASLIAAILEHEPPAMSTLQTMTPPVLDHVVRMCLEKDPDERWQSASDVMRQLKWITGEGSSTTVLPPAKTRSRLVPAIATGIVGALLAGLALWALVGSEPAEPTRRVSINLPTDAPLAAPRGVPATIVLSPDGSRLVYAGGTGDQSRLYLRSLDRLDVTPLPGTERARYPFFSPDGEWIGFFEWPGNTLKKVSVRGGPAVTLCETGPPWGASWSSNDTIIFAANTDNGIGLFRVPASGGAPEALTTPDPANREFIHFRPEALPNGKAVLFLIRDTTGFDPSRTRIAALSLESGDYHTVLEGGYSPRYAPSGHLLYLAGETLMAAPFHLEDLRTTGPPAPVLGGISGTPDWGTGSFSFSRDGSLAYLPSVAGDTLVWVDREGREVEPLVEEPLENAAQIQISPDGRRLALLTEGDIWVYYLDGRPPTRLTTGSSDLLPVWVQGGSRIAFSSSRAGGMDLFSMPSDGSSFEPDLILKNPYGKWLRAWSHRTEELIFDSQHGIMAIPIHGESEPRVVVQTEDNEGLSAISHDGRWLAYFSRVTGREEVWVRPYPGPGAPTRISPNGGSQPVWGPGDEELFYLQDGNKLMAVKISFEPELRFEAPQTLFESPYSHGVVKTPTYDVGPDGRFLMIKPVAEEGQARRELILVQNWFEELKRLVPTN